MTIRDGNGWVRCGLGHRHWGRYGAAGLLAYVAGGPVLLQQRTWWSHHGGTWGLPGGARDSHETVLAAAEREAAEECGVRPGTVRPRAIFTDDHGGWSYTTVLAQAPGPFEVKSDYDETEDVEWVDPVKVTQLSLHPASPSTGTCCARRCSRSRSSSTVRTSSVPARTAGGRTAPGRHPGCARSWSRWLRPGWRRCRETQAPAPATAAATGDGAELSATGRAAALRMTWLPEIVLVVEGAARPAAAEDGAGQGPRGRRSR